MTIYYLDPSIGNNANAGTDSGSPWATLQYAVNTIVAGDICYCRGTETLTGAVSVATGSGLVSATKQFIGVGSSWTEDGSRYVVNANNLRTNCLTFATQDYYTFSNFDLTSATSHCIDGSSYTDPIAITFYNCIIRNSGGNGIRGTQSRLTRANFIKCLIHGNVGHGAEHVDCNFLFCRISNNGAVGIYKTGNFRNAIVMGCIIVGNAQEGYLQDGFGVDYSVLISNVIDNNGRSGVGLNAGQALLFGNRITRNGGSTAGYAGIRNNWSTGGGLSYIGWNYLPATGSAFANAAVLSGTSIYLLTSGVDTNNLSGTDVSAGYTDPVNYDYNLMTSAWGYSNFIEIL